MGEGQTDRATLAIRATGTGLEEADSADRAITCVCAACGENQTAIPNEGRLNANACTEHSDY